MSQIYSREQAQILAKKYREGLEKISEKLILKEGEQFIPREYHIDIRIPPSGSRPGCNQPVAYFDPFDQKRIDNLLQNFVVNPYLIATLRTFLRAVENWDQVVEMERIFI